MDKENNSPTIANEENREDIGQSISCSPNANKRSRRVFRPTNASSSDFENYVRQEFTILRASLHQLNNTICEVSAQMKQISKNEVVNDRKISIAFPITTVEDLEKLDKKIEEEPDRYVDLFKKLVGGSGGIQKNFLNFISPDVAVLFNLNGASSKKPFKALKNINAVLFNAVKKEYPSTKLFDTCIRLAFKRIKNVHFKKMAALNKQAKQQTPDEVLFLNTASF